MASTAQHDDKSLDWIPLGEACQLSFVNGSDTELVPMSDSCGRIEIGCLTGMVVHDYVAPGCLGAVEICRVLCWQVPLTDALTADLMFGDSWLHPTTGKEYIVVGTPGAPGTWQGVAAAAGSTCITVVDPCGCGDGAAGVPAELCDCVTFNCETIADITFTGVPTITGPFAPGDEAALSAAIVAAGFSVDSVTYAGSVWTINGEFGEDGATVDYNCA